MTPTANTARTAGSVGDDAAGPAAPTTAPAVLSIVRDLVDVPLHDAVDRLSPSVRQVAAYHLGWVDADGTPQQAGGGKAVRAALAVLSAQACGASPAVGVPGALAVELVHNFSLLHDDVMDGDEERRHRPTAWTVFGSSVAILTGDALLTLAFQVLTDVGTDHSQAAERALAEATQRLIVGQVEDLDFEQRIDVSVDECLEMAAGKTAALMACSASIGAHLAGAGKPVVSALAAFGYELGVAFQLIDDLLGIWGATSTTGKPVGADLRARKKSLPVVAAMSGGAEPGRQLQQLYTSGELHADCSEQVVARAAELVEAAGGRAWASEEAARRLRLAGDALTSVELDPAARESLLQIADYVTARDH